MRASDEFRLTTVLLCLRRLGGIITDGNTYVVVGVVDVIFGADEDDGDTIVFDKRLLDSDETGKETFDIIMVDFFPTGQRYTYKLGFLLNSTDNVTI